MRPNVELIDGAVERITATGVVGPDGKERPRLDTIIWGTPSSKTKDFVALDGDQGPLEDRDLNDVWGAPRGLPRHHRLRLPEHVREVRFNYHHIYVRP